ncbi:MAG: hypothetical protein BGN86_10105 [Caulobacterales bacterium 68-7]|nr:hypothetical protein [Caulobacterales bacterium]OJU11261.1 MAG: hypothetical protein BGN86_10105 [Caulobacterales bacterium 68-7]
METPLQIRERWSYLRDLLIEQLGRFESGALKIHASDVNVSKAAIDKLKKSIAEFDTLISRSEARQRAEDVD